jgi:hypothetical protein
MPMLKDARRIGLAGDRFPSNLKRLLLLFDTIGIADLEGNTAEARDRSRLFPELEQVANDLEYCATKGLVFEPFDVVRELKLAKTVSSKANVEALGAAIIAVEKSRRESGRDPEAYLKKLWGLEERRQQLGARIFAKDLAHGGYETSTVISGDLVSVNDSVGINADVIKVVLTRLPEPDDSVPWEKVFDFRDDPENQGYLNGLRVWMREASRGALTATELAEKLEWLIHQREQHLRAHNIAQNQGTFGATFIASMEIIENLSKLKLGAVAKGIVALSNRKAELLKTEMSAPANEIAYLVRARDRFK